MADGRQTDRHERRIERRIQTCAASELEIDEGIARPLRDHDRKRHQAHTAEITGAGVRAIADSSVRPRISQCANTIRADDRADGDESALGRIGSACTLKPEHAFEHEPGLAEALARGRKPR